MLILLISIAICTILVFLTVILIKLNQSKKVEGELLRLSETRFTAVMGGMAIAMGFFIICMKYLNTSLVGNDLTSYIFVGIFAVGCTLVGCGILFYTFIQKVIAYEDKIVFVSILGKSRELYWKEIVEIKTTFISNKVTLIGNKSKIYVGGEPKKYKEFLKIAKKKIKPEVGSEVLQNLLNRSLS